MTNNETQNRRYVLASRPFGAPEESNFRFETTPVPSPGEGEVLIRASYLSLDPYMRGRMNDGPSYAAPVKIDEVMVGSVAGRIVESNNPKFEVGEWVVANSGWQDYAVSDGSDLFKLGKDPEKPSYALGIMGMPGFTAYMGLLDIGQPRAGECLVVAAATGPVGATVGQIGKLKGCRVVGVAGGSEKCQFAKDVLGFDECLDHRAPDFKERMKQACPDGIDIYFESVGGKVLKAVLPLLNPKSRIPLCGLVSAYNMTELPEGPDRSSQLLATFLVKRVKVQGFIIFDDYGDRYGEFTQQMSQWVKAGQIKYREQMVETFEEAPSAFIGLLEGKNLGKLVVKMTTRRFPDSSTAASAFSK